MQEPPRVVPLQARADVRARLGYSAATAVYDSVATWPVLATVTAKPGW